MENDDKTRIEELEATVALLLDEVDQLKRGARDDRPTAPEGRGGALDDPSSPTAERVDRRRLLTRAGTAAVGAVLGGAAVSVASASPAAAATGSFDTSDDTPALTATTSGAGAAVLATTTGPGAAVDIDVPAGASGRALRIVAREATDSVVVATEEVMIPVSITSPKAFATLSIENPEGTFGVLVQGGTFGVLAEVEGDATFGLSGGSDGGVAGVTGQGTGGAMGTIGAAPGGIGVGAVGDKAALTFRPDPNWPNPLTPPRSRTDAHTAGEVVFDDEESLWLCVVDGSPGAWVRLAGPGSAGAFQVLPAPIRAYDTRPNYEPPLGPKTPMPANQARTINLTDADVPSDATAATVSATVTNTTGGAPWGPGYLSLYAGGTPQWPGTSNLNWTGPGQTVAVTTVVPLGPDATLNAYAKHPTDLILDVIGYYR